MRTELGGVRVYVRLCGREKESVKKSSFTSSSRPLPMLFVSGGVSSSSFSADVTDHHPCKKYTF
eukprot:298349-Pyramimonas_sp.AAC.1